MTPRKMLPVLVLCALILSVAPDETRAAFGLVPLWTARFGETNVQMGRAIAVDPWGNVIVAGDFSGTINFGGATLTCAGSFDIFLVKFDSQGHHVWSKRFGDSSNQFAKGIAVDASGNVTITGYFQGAVDFGGATLTSAGGDDGFLAAFGPSGNHLWSRRFGDASAQQGYGVAVDPSGNVVAIGTFLGAVNLGGETLTSAGLNDIYLAKYDVSGGHLWSKRLGNYSQQYGCGVALDAASNIFITGYFDMSIDLGGGTLTGAGGWDIYLAKFSPGGAHRWSKRFGSASHEYGICVAADDDNDDVVLAGYFVGTADFGGGPLSSKGLDDAYLARFDSTGAHRWSKRFGDANEQYAYALAVDGLGNVLLTGSMQGSVDFGGGTLTSAGLDDVFLARFRPDGSFSFGQRFGDTSPQYGYAVASDDSGQAVMTGSFGGTIDLGTGPLVEPGTGRDVFVAKYWPAQDEPRILSCLDVPRDQGGWLRIKLEASAHDAGYGAPPVASYTAWRKIVSISAALGAGAASPDEAQLLGLPPGSWEAVGYANATQDRYYYLAVPTRNDSTASGIARDAFIVTAHTTTPSVYYTSAADSGYSVDNLAPGVPLALAGEQSYAPEGLALTWTPNVEKDLANYRVYRGTSADFVPAPANRVGSPATTSFFDGAWDWSAGYYYKVAAVDRHGNEGRYALLAPEAITGTDTPKAPAASFLAQNFPNPFNPTTRITFGLAAPGDVSLRIYDAAGRLVRVLAEGARPAGNYSELWDGRDSGGRAVASGIYFYRLQAGSFTETRKMALLR